MSLIAEPRSADSGPADRRGSRRHWRWLFAAAAVVLAASVTIAAVAVHRRHHYLDAAPLTFGGSSVWAPPDNLDTRIGSTRLAAAVRRGHDQSFLIEFHNPAAVTQTILGLNPVNGPTSQPPDRIEISTDNQQDRGGAVTIDQLHYAPVPVAVPPGADRVLRYTTHVNTCWLRGRADIWTGLDLRVRVGGYTRVEYVKLQTHMVLVARRTNCFHTTP